MAHFSMSKQITCNHEFFNVLKVENLFCAIINMMKIFHFLFKMLKKPHFESIVKYKNLNASICKRCPILQNGLHVEETLNLLRNQVNGALKNTFVLLNWACYNQNISKY